MQTDGLTRGSAAAILDQPELYGADVTGAVERIRELTRTAVLGSPWATFSLTDVMPDDLWIVVLSSQKHSLDPVLATLAGCADALSGRGVTVGQVVVTATTPPLGSAATEEDMSLARRWLTEALVRLDEGRCRDLVAADVAERGWRQNPHRLSSLVLALVAVGRGTAIRASSWS